VCLRVISFWLVLTAFELAGGFTTMFDGNHFSEVELNDVGGLYIHLIVPIQSLPPYLTPLLLRVIEFR
jgi:hypothetical protein